MADEWEEIRLIEGRVAKRRARTLEQDQDLQEAAVRPTKDAIPTG